MVTDLLCEQPVVCSLEWASVHCPHLCLCSTQNCRPLASEAPLLRSNNSPSLVSRLLRNKMTAIYPVLLVGILISYWIAYGTNYIGGTTYPGQSSAAWRIPLSLQMIPAAILCVGAIFLPFSPRWLVLRIREEGCLAGLAWLRSRSATSPEVQYEFRSLLAERQADRAAAQERYRSQDVTWRTKLLEYKRIFTNKTLLFRTSLGAIAQGLGQFSGINAIIYYAPTVFAQVGLSGGTIGLLATGVVGVVNFVMTIPAVLFIDNIGRKPMLCWGLANMGLSHACRNHHCRLWS